MENIKEFINKDLIQNKSDFYSTVTNDFIGDDFIEQLEWAMLLIQSKFKQVKFAEYLSPVSANHFDKAFLMSCNLNDNIKFFAPQTSLQVSPEIFPLLNIKMMMIDETISLLKVKEMDALSKRGLQISRKYAFEFSSAFYKKDTECFYGQNNGYELNNSFFRLNEKENLEFSDLPKPISLHPNYTFPKNAIKYLSAEDVIEITNKISMAYQVAMSMYYEWSIYIKEYNNVGFVIPIDPKILSEIFKTSMMNFENKKMMLQFVKSHYRRKIASENEDYSVFVRKYVRGEHKFNYRGFYAEIIPPKYDLNRLKTKKKFINATN